MKITRKMLEELLACGPGFEWFAEEFGEEATWEKVIPALQRDGHYDWVAWLCQNCPAGVSGATWAARLGLMKRGWQRAWLGQYCPAGVPDATWETRLSVQQNAIDRARFGRICPVGVPGATLEARLAVQMDDAGRALVMGKFGKGER